MLKNENLGFTNFRVMKPINSDFYGGTTNPSNSFRQQSLNVLNPKKRETEKQGFTTVESTSDAMIDKRTEYLELQERKITATLSTTQSETNRLIQKLEKVENDHNIKSQSLFMETQWVYGTSQSEVYGIQITNKPNTIIENYKKCKDKKLSKIMKKGEKGLFYYPMEKVEVSENLIQYFMKQKMVDPLTGQFTCYWTLVYEYKDGKEYHAVKDFCF